MKAKGIKAIFAAILAVVLLTFSFTGCTHKEKIVIDKKGALIWAMQANAKTSLF